jgi:hypothetical protein
MAEEEIQVPILLPKSECPICHQTFYTKDIDNHIKLVHKRKITPVAISDTEPEKKSLQTEAKKFSQQKKWRAETNFEHSQVIKKLKIKENVLPNDLKLRMLRLDMSITQIRSQDEFDSCVSDSKVIAGLIKDWNKQKATPITKKNGTDEISQEEILEQGHNILSIVRGSLVNDESSATFLNSVLGHLGFLHKAKTYAALLTNPVKKMEFDNLLELIEKTTSEKLSHAKPVEATKPEPKKKFISPSAPQLKKQYEEVLKKNIVPIIAHLEEEKKRYLASVHAYMKLNTTSVFTYRFDEATGEITGSIEGCASIKIPFKS